MCGSRFISYLLFCGCLFLFAACSGSSPKQEIEEILSKREQALANKDLDLYTSLISANYADKNKTFQEIKLNAERNFAAFGKIEMTSHKRSVYIDNSQAVVVQEYVLSFWLPSGRRSIKDKERLVLQKEEGGWKIIQGL
ncbi:MAG: nuclear transport factor 2 family protein [Candidatus Schekmanbacteria bacterium]|nr:nuclear transport factor 2 family protein [Candidatus Schekmanbacteria bacterium]